MAKTTIDVHDLGIGSGVVPIVNDEKEWLRLTIIAHSPRVILGSRNVQNETGALPLPMDTPIEILVAPGSTLFAGAPSGGTFSVIRQPLPFIAQLALAVQRMLGLRTAA